MANLAKIPGGLTPEHFIGIQKHLRKMLSAVDAVAREVEPRWASCRLNETTDDISPVFIGWVEHEITKAARERKNSPDPGLFRFGDDHYSQIYEECVKEPGTVKKRDWTRDSEDPLKGRWMESAKTLSVGAGIMYRRSIGIKIGNRAVGTLNIGFKKNPAPKDASIERAIKKWSDSKSPLVAYVIKNFQLGGPTI